MYCVCQMERTGFMDESEEATYPEAVDFDAPEKPYEPEGDPNWRGGGASPHNIYAEQALLGGVLLDPDQFDFIEGKIIGQDFFVPSHEMIFDAMLALRKRQQPIDGVLLHNELKAEGRLDAVGGVAGLSALTDAATSGANVEHYADIVKELAALRRLIKVSLDTAKAAQEPDANATELLGNAENDIRSIVTRNFTGKILTVRDVMQKTWENIEKFIGNNDLVNGLATGYNELDDILSGLHEDELIIVAGRPAMGKTTFALNILRNVVTLLDAPAILFTLEMSAENIIRNMLAAQAHVEGEIFRKLRFTDEVREKLDIATEQLNDAPLYVDDTPAISLSELRGKVRHLALRKNLQLIVIDYLQLMTASAVARNRSREQEVSEVSRGLKALAKELHIPVIALSQLSRKPEGRQDSRPILSDLRESGAIEQDADVVLMLHRPEYYNPEDKPGEAEVIVAKQRNGPTGSANLAFIKNQLRFENLSLRADYNMSDAGM